jgi:hypothetical protein
MHVPLPQHLPDLVRSEGRLACEPTRLGLQHSRTLVQGTLALLEGFVAHEHHVAFPVPGDIDGFARLMCHFRDGTVVIPEPC